MFFVVVDIDVDIDDNVDIPRLQSRKISASKQTPSASGGANMVMERGEHSGGQLGHFDDDHGDDYVDGDHVDDDHVDDKFVNDDIVLVDNNVEEDEFEL